MLKEFSSTTAYEAMKRASVHSDSSTCSHTYTHMGHDVDEAKKRQGHGSPCAVVACMPPREIKPAQLTLLPQLATPWVRPAQPTHYTRTSSRQCLSPSCEKQSGLLNAREILCRSRDVKRVARRSLLFRVHVFLHTHTPPSAPFQARMQSMGASAFPLSCKRKSLPLHTMSSHP